MRMQSGLSVSNSNVKREGNGWLASMGKVYIDVFCLHETQKKSNVGASQCIAKNEIIALQNCYLPSNICCFVE